uniref:Uncharacterized protein n=1 Tax=Panagrellus redivivus TaxID=6233 RepID=A0A7E4VIR5_PANRE
MPFLHANNTIALEQCQNVSPLCVFFDYDKSFLMALHFGISTEPFRFSDVGLPQTAEDMSFILNYSRKTKYTVC